MNTYNTGIAYGSFDYEAPFCHTGPIDVMDIGGSVIWAGGWNEMDDDLTYDLRIRMNEMWSVLDGSPLISSDAAAKKLFAAHPSILDVKFPPTISIKWPDFGTPPMDKEWWVSLAAALADMPAESNVALYCQGGHGRTGTALAILAYLSGNVPPNTDPVYWVRKNYCEEAVESWAQIDYIKQITGEEITSLPTSQLKANKQKDSFVDGWEKDETGMWKKKVPGQVTKISEANSVFKSAKAKVKKMAKWEGI